jgi:hypothetical protein
MVTHQLANLQDSVTSYAHLLSLFDELRLQLCRHPAIARFPAAQAVELSSCAVYASVPYLLREEERRPGKRKVASEAALAVEARAWRPRPVLA